jgi:hypothetical protein
MNMIYLSWLLWFDNKSKYMLLLQSAIFTIAVLERGTNNFYVGTGIIPLRKCIQMIQYIILESYIKRQAILKNIDHI